jgi:SAM-dependent methyltransferase
VSTERRSHYVHGSSPEEQARLGLMNDILERRCLDELALNGSERILDVGCGVGAFTLAMGRAVPRGRVLAIERDERQLEQAKSRVLLASSEPGEADLERRIELRRGDAYDLPLEKGEWGSLDVAWSRFLLEHVDDPQRVVDALVRAVRPGGRIVLCDDDHDVLRLDPPVPAFEKLGDAYLASYRDHGNDPAIGRRLPRLLVNAGAVLDRTTWVFFGSCAGAPDWRLVIDNCRVLLEQARSEIERHLAPVQVDRALSEFRDWSLRPDASFWLPLAWAEGRKPPSGGRGM